MSRLWLVGMPGSGKSSVGLAIADELGLPFFDTDVLVELLENKTIPEIWEADGEAAFRAVESHVVAGAAESPGVVACGGGAVLDPANRKAMSTGTVVWLKAQPATLAARLEGEPGRPLLAGVLLDRVIEIMQERESIYEEVADHTIDTDGLTVEEVAREVVARWRG